MYVCGSNHTCRPDVHRFSVVGVLDDFGGNMAKIAGERGELLVGTMKELCSAKRVGGKDGGLTCQSSDADVTVGVC